MSYDYDSWLQDSSAYEEWAGIEEKDEYDEDEYYDMRREEMLIKKYEGEV